MTVRPQLRMDGASVFKDTSFTCPHCGVLQAQDGIRVDINAAYVDTIQCQNCNDIVMKHRLVRDISGNRVPEAQSTFYPSKGIRPARNFRFASPEVEKAYQDACFLRPIHVGASGAYARRALELILERLGYGSKILAQSIEAAQKDSDPGRRLRKTLLLRLEYVKEIGNFALHVRRDQELIIIEIAPEEVDACLETIEELIETCFEEPALDRERVVALNEKLASAGRKQIALPELESEVPLIITAIEDQSET